MSRNKSKANRARMKRQTSGRLLSVARRTHSSWLPSYFVKVPGGYHDGKLVHTVFRGKRTFPFDSIRSSEWTVWATGCNQVIAVEKVGFTWTKNPATCLMCVTLDHRSLKTDGI